jgi:hypothetical protein
VHLFLLRLMVLGVQPVLLLGIGAVTLSAALPWPAMSASMRSNIASIAYLLAAAIGLSCASCCSWRRVKIIVVVLLLPLLLLTLALQGLHP